MRYCVAVMCWLFIYEFLFVAISKGFVLFVSEYSLYELNKSREVEQTYHDTLRTDSGLKVFSH